VRAAKVVHLHKRLLLTAAFSAGAAERGRSPQPRRAAAYHPVLLGHLSLRGVVGDARRGLLPFPAAVLCCHGWVRAKGAPTASGGLRVAVLSLPWLRRAQAAAVQPARLPGPLPPLLL
jgi:hypothetical protein